MTLDKKTCTKTVLDNIADPDIVFNSEGVSNYYFEYREKLKYRVPSQPEGKEQLEKLVEQIKISGKGKKYDCVIGLSGGVDSTYTAWLVKSLGLRPLAVHLDNGWNSELAVRNIEQTVDKLGIDLYTEVLDWRVFKDLQKSFLYASTPDGEIPTDHIIVSILYKMAAKHNIKHIISGMNFRNEGFLPPTWARGYLDWKYIKGVQKRFGKEKISNLPHLSFVKFIQLNLLKGIRSVSFINYIEFNKSEAIRVLERELDWRNYGGKHYESIYTRFYQGYILPKKFNIDKRKAHLSCLIMSTGEITREAALKILEQPALSEDIIRQDLEYVKKKLGLSSEEFSEIMNAPVKSINDYSNNHNWEKRFRKLLNFLRSKKIMPN